ncbi:Hypothetical predicted protein [Podarcis lilfordi]|uniref:Uncharacterized protein n=1 Tax=Podarcis lilfordi TaxID=74358 RepID=A0AA35PN77_9SAUR|nr:Hypothetical predicted protein [Podarcis lilfordi]
MVRAAPLRLQETQREEAPVRSAGLASKQGVRRTAALRENKQPKPPVKQQPQPNSESAFHSRLALSRPPLAAAAAAAPPPPASLPTAPKPAVPPSPCPALHLFFKTDAGERSAPCRPPVEAAGAALVPV